MTASHIEMLEVRTLLSSTGWTQVVSSPLVRAEETKAVCNGKFYVVGGFSGVGLSVTKELDVYDPVANTWTRLADCPVPETHGGAAVYGNDIWIAGFFFNDGVTASSLVYMYDTTNNTWTQEPSLPAGRGAVGMAIIGTEIHVWGGLTGQTQSADDHWAIDVTNTSAGWKTLAPLPEKLDHVGGVALDGKLWSLGGFVDKNEEDGNESDVYTYDPTSNTWSKDTAQLPVGLGHIGPDTTVAGEDIIIAGGQVNASYEDEITTVYKYDALTNTWSTLASLPADRKSACCGFADGELIVSNGNQPTSPYASDVTWVMPFTPDTSTPTNPTPPSNPTPPTNPTPPSDPTPPSNPTPPSDPTPPTTPVTTSPPTTTTTPTPPALPTNPDGPDFTGQLTVHMPKGSIIAGERGIALLIVKNGGTGAAVGPLDVALLASTDGTTTDATTVATVNNHKINLKHNRQTVIKIIFTLPDDLASGSYTMLGSIDTANTFEESNETNNVATGATLAVTARQIDVALMSGTEAPDIVAAGKAVIMRQDVSNLGNVEDAGKATFTITLAPADDPASTQTVATVVRAVALSAGRSKIIALSFHVPADFAAGEYLLTVSMSPLTLVDDNPANDTFSSSQLLAVR